MFVRTASERDVPAIRKLLVETWHDTYDALYGVEKVTEITDDWHSIRSLTARLVQPRSEYLVADDGKVLGGMAFAQAEESGDSVELRQLYVLPPFQGRGIGGMLMEEILVSFPEAKRFVLEVEAANEKAIGFYLSHGFVDVGESDDLCRHAGVSETVRKMVLERAPEA
jgi:ribosomal protein S18 acetylase RimI-like enzyme